MVIFHHPRPLDPDPAVASSLRPMRMCEAFRELGEEVVEVAGDGDDRIRMASHLEQRLASCCEVDGAVLYGESVIVPPALTWLRKNPLRLNSDYKFLKRIHDRGIPTGVFYRDIHWILAREKAFKLRALVRNFLTPFFARQELQFYRRFLDVLFLPHENMAEYLPVDFPGALISSLPPGGEIREPAGREGRQRGPGVLRMIYVGNIAPPIYDLRPYISGIDASGCAELTLVTRPRALRNYADLYGFANKPRIKPMEGHGKLLDPLYAEADIALTALGECDYLSFAMPVKVFEAVSFGIPQIVSGGLTVAAELIEKENLGWVVKDAEELVLLLQRLSNHPEEIAAKRESVVRAQERHTWQARARSALTTLRRSAGREG